MSRTALNQRDVLPICLKKPGQKPKSESKRSEAHCSSVLSTDMALVSASTPVYDDLTTGTQEPASPRIVKPAWGLEQGTFEDAAPALQPLESDATRIEVR